jgi:hypothetical protein
MTAKLHHTVDVLSTNSAFWIVNVTGGSDPHHIFARCDPANRNNNEC